MTKTKKTNAQYQAAWRRQDELVRMRAEVERLRKLVAKLQKVGQAHVSEQSAAELHKICARYREWETTGPAEFRYPIRGGGFDPWCSMTATPRRLEAKPHDSPLLLGASQCALHREDIRRRILPNHH